MGLSDVCFEFLEAVSTAADDLARGVHHYSDPESPIPYGSEIDALRQACAAAPETQVASAREAEMKKLVHLLQAEFDGDEAAAVPAVVKNVVAETGYTERASKRLKAMLPKLGKSAYDIAIKIISDIGSATVKRLLGL